MGQAFWIFGFSPNGKACGYINPNFAKPSLTLAVIQPPKLNKTLEMNELNKIRRENQIKKLVSNARAIISNEIGMPMGSLKMERIILWINDIEPLTEIQLDVFTSYNNQTNEYPIGVDRLGYNKDYLLELDVKLDEITHSFKNLIIEKCFEIIQKYGKQK